MTQLRGLATTTQRSYIHYVAGFAKHFHRSTEELDLEAVRQYQLYLSQVRKTLRAEHQHFRFRRAFPLPDQPGDAVEQGRPSASPRA